jgi:hypothetical protein
VRPQPAGTAPQSAPSCSQVAAVQHVPSAVHCPVPPQLPQLPPQPSGPHTALPHCGTHCGVSIVAASGVAQLVPSQLALESEDGQPARGHVVTSAATRRNERDKDVMRLA